MGYWEKRYSSGGSSGAGSVGASRAWKWSVLDEFVGPVHRVIDVGCGDLSFWENRDCDDYTGIDLSKTVIEVNKKKKPKWNFLVSSAETYIDGLKGDCVFCLDTLFHIMDNDAFNAILENLCRYATRYIVIHTWTRNPLTLSHQLSRILMYLLRGRIKTAVHVFARSILTPHTDGKYQCFRSLEHYLVIFKKRGFVLIAKHCNPIDHFGALYVFQKIV